MSWVVHQAQAFLPSRAQKNCDLAADVTARLVLTSPEGADFVGLATWPVPVVSKGVVRSTSQPQRDAEKLAPSSAFSKFSKL